MRWIGEAEHGHRRFALAVWFLVAGLGGLWAQDQAASAPEESLHTLHVYMDLIQVPVLVLSSTRETMKPVEPSRFLVSLDGGPAFKPKRVRLENDDPITLGVLLDVTSEQSDLMPKMARALAALAPDSLHAKDHVSVFVLDCTLVRSLKDKPADPQLLASAVDRGLAPWLETRKMHKRPPCEKRVGLSDAVARAAQDLAGLPGRRVLLVVTDGFQRVPLKETVLQFKDARSVVQLSGVAVFGLVPSQTALAGSYVARQAQGLNLQHEDGFNGLCESTGGLELHADSPQLAAQMKQFVELVRGRYIVEFGRPRDDAPGEHAINITIAKTSAFIRPAAVSVSIPDPTERNGDDVIPTDKTDAPQLGKQKPKPSS